MGIDLSKCTAIVTGGSKGYGAGISEALKAKGVDVWITGRNEKDLKATAQRMDVHFVKADITKGEDWDSLLEEVLKISGRLDILINNAGAAINIASTEEQTDEDITESITVNLIGPIMGCSRAARIMQKQKSGTIINISSVCARQAWPGWSVYSAAKGGLVQFSKGLYTELRESGVRVTSVIPSWGATEFGTTARMERRDAETSAKCIQPLELGDIIANICSIPSHLEIQEITILPLIQEIIPL